MVNFSSEYFLETKGLVVGMPDFYNGATPLETARFFNRLGQHTKAKYALLGGNRTPDRVVYVLTHPGIGGFKEIGNKGVQFVNIDTIGTSYQLEVHDHERVHNAQEDRWNEINIPGYEYMTPARRAIIFSGMSELSELQLVEGLTQYATQEKLQRKTQSGYDGFEVPESQKILRTLEKKSGKKIVGSFLHMALDGVVDGKQEFADGVRIGGNIMLLEEVLRESRLPEADAQKMSEIIEAQKKDFVVRDIAHAKRLVQSYQEAQVKKLALAN